MGERIEEECGVAAVYMKNRTENSGYVPHALNLMLEALQHRGQTGTGITIYHEHNGASGKTFRHRKKTSSAAEFFGLEGVDEFYNGISGLGHVRYGTSGDREESSDSTQPFYRRHGENSKRFAIAYNGNIANYNELRQQFAAQHFDLETEVDTEVLMHLLSKSLDAREGYSNDNAREIWEEVCNSVDGAYSIATLLDNGVLNILRDPQGFKPLVYGETEECYAFASETVALKQLGITQFNSVEPGNLVVVEDNDLKFEKINEAARAHCHFEYVYFMNKASHFEGESVFSIRQNLGRALAEKEPLAEDLKAHPGDYVIVPVPESAIPAAEAFAYHFNAPYMSALDRINPKRGFINAEKKRDRIMSSKYQIIPEVVDGKKVILIDDSIVRSETLKKVISLFRGGGNPSEVHVRVTEPPIKHPCFYGVDFASFNELIANVDTNGRQLEDVVAQRIDADSFVFMDIDRLGSAVEMNPEDICNACLTGNYPTPFGNVRADEMRE